MNELLDYLSRTAVQIHTDKWKPLTLPLAWILFFVMVLLAFASVTVAFLLDLLRAEE